MSTNDPSGMRLTTRGSSHMQSGPYSPSCQAFTASRTRHARRTHPATGTTGRSAGTAACRAPVRKADQAAGSRPWPSVISIARKTT
jgi:hypothetical protein